MAFKMKYEKSGFPFKQEEDVDPIAAAAARMGENSGDASAEISSIGSNYAEGLSKLGAGIGKAVGLVVKGVKNKSKKKKKKKEKAETDAKKVIDPSKNPHEKTEIDWSGINEQIGGGKEIKIN